MYVHKGQLIRVFIDARPKAMEEGVVEDITDEFIRISKNTISLTIPRDQIAGIHPCPHPNPDHMFDRYSLEVGDEITITYYSIDGGVHEKTGTVVRVSKSTMILHNEYENRYEIIAPYNLKDIIFKRYRVRKQKEVV